jgi:hypothetical protein
VVEVQAVAAETIQTLQILQKMVEMELLHLEHILVEEAAAEAQRFMTMFTDLILHLAV